MSAKIVQWLFENNSRYSGTKLLLLLTIGWIIKDEEGSAEIYTSTLLKRNGLSKNSKAFILHKLRELEKEGAIKIIRSRAGADRNHASRYQILMDPAAYRAPGGSEEDTTPEEGGSGSNTTGGSGSDTTPEGGSGSDTTGGSGSNTTVVADRTPQVVADRTPLKGLRKGSLNGLRKEEEDAPAAPAAAASQQSRRPTTEAEAARIWTEVTGMITIPGTIEIKDHVVATILDLGAKHGDATAQQLKPYWQAMTLAKNQNGRAYDKTRMFWLGEWAVAEQIPDNIITQVMSLPPATIPEELAAYIQAHTNGKKPVAMAGGRRMTEEELAEAGQLELERRRAARAARNGAGK